jgi:hypothetical protein
MFDINRQVKRRCRNMMPGLFHRSQRMELEDQLHCMIEEFAVQGCSPEQALQLALARLGQLDSVKAEYRKNFFWHCSMKNPYVQIASIAVCCGLGIAVGVIWRNQELIPQARSLLVTLSNIHFLGTLKNMFFAYSSW